jgi:hypothetical protein
VPPSLRATADEATWRSLAERTPVQTPSTLGEVFETSPTVRFLSPSERRSEEEELLRVETERAEQEELGVDVETLQPLPVMGESPDDPTTMSRSGSDEPLVKPPPGNIAK